MSQPIKEELSAEFITGVAKWWGKMTPTQRLVWLRAWGIDDLNESKRSFNNLSPSTRSAAIEEALADAKKEREYD